MSPTPGAGIMLHASPARSPVKPARADVSLALRQVVGTTASSANALDSLPAGRAFAYTAGAAAVIATVDDQLRLSQRFYRARPTTTPLNASASVYGGPSTPTQNESRNRTAASLRDAGYGAASPLASPAALDWADSPGNKPWTAKEKVKAARCVSFSHDGRFLAVGETGYKPRVLIFSTAPDAPSDTPLTSLPEHTIGVNCLAFSPDSRYLASLGYSTDGYLYIWSIDPRTGAASLYASNKCISTVNRIAWIGNKLITVGQRHVRVWKVDDPKSSMRLSKARASDASFPAASFHKPLQGRNCLLDSLKEATFTSVVAVAPNKAIVASERGHVCLIDDSASDQRFVKLFDAGFPVSSMALDANGRLHLAGNHGALKTVFVREMLASLTPPPSPPPRVESPTVCVTESNQIGAIVCLAHHVVTVDSQRAIRLSHLCAVDDDTVVGDVAHTLPAHGDSVLGVAALSTQPNAMNASYYTWAADGTILFWNMDGSFKDSLHVTLEQLDVLDAVVNELRTVCASADASYLVTGDKYGVLRIIDTAQKTSVYDFKAHAGEITSISVFEEGQCALVACASRDRTVQIFSRTSETWDLLQTLDEHAGAVNGIRFSRDGKRLVSSSSDRSIVVRDLLSREDGQGRTIRAFVMLRTIVLKASPVSMTWDIDNDGVLLVSSIDRQVHRYDTRNGQCLNSFRACDNDGGDAVILSSLVHIPRGWSSSLIAGVSSTDKSIRIYEENGTLTARDWGHTEGVSDISLIQKPTGNDSDKSLVTVAVDGTIFIWDLALQPNRHDLSRSMDLLGPSTPTNSDLLASRPPLRRVFSQSELARFQRSPEEDNVTPTGNKSPKLRKRMSKVSLAQTPKLEPSPLPSGVREGRTTGWQGQGSIRRSKNRSPSPPSPRNTQMARRLPPVDTRARTKAPTHEFGSLGASTEMLCRTLRAFRKRLATSNDTLSSELAREVERELATTARAIGDRVKPKEIDETIMVKLLDQYSERLVSMLDERIAASVAQRVRENSLSISEGAESPGLDQIPRRTRSNSETRKGLAAEGSAVEEHTTDTLIVQSIEPSTDA
ncbi:WD40-repeat-containing domain protein [Ampelomyces quisqualis]|uniref:WD40-repeat-containing domain protein n=1 Tax=Ampelomyces quisqualis TaxID=50730 RepID=A0A6A5QMN5_AMPQU|nr:WD40-repeat-containing domain protein [Ampelomyces quisqualis]